MLTVTDTDKHSSTVEYNDDNPWRDESVLRILYHDEGLSLPQIGDKFGISHQAVLYWFKKHGIDRRKVMDYYDSADYSITHSKREAKRQILFCEECGDMYEVVLSNVAERKYCSQDCAKSGYSKDEYVKTDVTCQNCADSFRGMPHRKYCSHECYSEDVYEGGRTLAELYRGMERRRGWIESVFERDDYTCQRCGDRGGRLQAHHTTPVAEIADDLECRSEVTDHELFNDTSNGITLCIDCHQKIHYGDDNE